MGEYSLVGLVLADTETEEKVIEAWEAKNTSGITVVDCKGPGLPGHARGVDDLPLFPGLDTFLESLRADQKLLFTFVEGGPRLEEVLEVTQREVGDLSQPGKGVLFALPLAFVKGL